MLSFLYYFSCIFWIIFSYDNDFLIKSRREIENSITSFSWWSKFDFLMWLVFLFLEVAASQLIIYMLYKYLRLSNLWKPLLRVFLFVYFVFYQIWTVRFQGSLMFSDKSSVVELMQAVSNLLLMSPLQWSIELIVIFVDVSISC